MMSIHQTQSAPRSGMVMAQMGLRSRLAGVAKITDGNGLDHLK